MSKEAWFCPSCQKHHAPHVETCPGGTGGIPPNPVHPVYPGYRPWPGETASPFQPPWFTTCGSGGVVVKSDPSIMMWN